MEIYEFAIRVGCAVTAGFLIGIEREFKNKNAGLKTNMLVALGAAVFILGSLRFIGMEYIDSTRVLGQVVVGVGFLGAGAILKKNATTITGLTTAATIWCSAATGSLAALGMYWELLIVTGLWWLLSIISLALSMPRSIQLKIKIRKQGNHPFYLQLPMSMLGNHSD